MTHVTIREVCLRDGLQIEEPISLGRQDRAARGRRRHRVRGGGHRIRLTVEGTGVGQRPKIWPSN